MNIKHFLRTIASGLYLIVCKLLSVFKAGIIAITPVCTLIISYLFKPSKMIDDAEKIGKKKK